MLRICGTDAPPRPGSLTNLAESKSTNLALRAVVRTSRELEGIHQAFSWEAKLSEINWAVELRKIEREFDGLPPEPSAAEIRQKRDVERRDRERQEAAGASFGVYFRLTLVVCLAISIVCWPYDTSCGATLWGYLSAVLVLIVAGIWTAQATFTWQMPTRHLAALLMILWGLCLGAAQVLPRIGYANPAPGRPTTWRCGE